MTAQVILVRHALPEVEQGVSSKLWGLSEAAREDCVLLAHALPPGISAIYSSDERKARETADVLALRLGLQVQTDERFAEVDRPQVWDRDYREVAAGYLAGAEERGWEPRERVVRRFGAAVQVAGVDADSRVALPGPAPTEGRDYVVVVSHGMAMSLWIASVVPSLDVVQFWRSLTFPDAWLLDPEGHTAEHLWLGGTPA